LEKSSIHRSVWSPCCMLFTMSLTMSSNCVSHDRCGRNPCWGEYKMLYRSAWFMSALQIMCSISLDAMQVRLAQRYFWPFLNTGATFAHLQDSGTCPVASDFRNISVRGPAITSLSSFSTHGLVLSGPGAFPGLRFLLSKMLL